MKSKRKVSAIILSAGYSSRMGDFKPLFKIGDRTALEHIVYNFYEANVKDIIVVVGHKAQEIQKAYKGPEIKFVYNKHYSEGMYSSVVEGVKHLDKENAGFFILPVDIPIIKHLTINEIVKAFKEGNKGIVYPNFNGKRGHPPLISSTYINEVINNDEDGGLRNLLSNYESNAYDVKVVDQGTLLDMDAPEDYRNLLDYYKNYDIPNEEECKAILNKYCISEDIIRHSEKVKEVALKISNDLIKRGVSLNLRLIEASALLHDIEKDKPRHADKGAELLNDLGYPNVAEIIESHMDIIIENDEISEKEIIYLSDKMVIEDMLVSIEKRFERPLNKFKADKEVIQMIRKRIMNAKKIRQKIDKFGEDDYEIK